MALSGRKPKPASQRRREGKAGHRPIVEGFTPTGEPERPAFLSPTAAAEWDRVVPELMRAGLAARVHSGPLTAMCVAWGIAEDARLVVEEEGLVEMGSTGQMVEHPLIGTYTRAVMTYMRIATEFGMTASAAMRVEAERSGGTGDPFGDPLGGIGQSPRLRAVK